MDFGYCFTKQIEMHPSMQYQDVIKLCYQAAFGAEHILSDPEKAHIYLRAEFESVPITDEPIFEEISPDVVRVNLGAWKREGYSVDLLFEIFRISARINANAKEIFLSYLDETERIMASQMSDFDVEEWHGFIDEYKSAGIHPVHHSAKYREGERPSYRIVKTEELKKIL